MESSMAAGLRVELETMLPSSLEKEEYQDCFHAILIFWSLRAKLLRSFTFQTPPPLTAFHGGLKTGHPHSGIFYQEELCL